MRRAGDCFNAAIKSLFAAPDLRRRVVAMLTLIGGVRLLHRVIETVW
jgi:hypothetical protein